MQITKFRIALFAAFLTLQSCEADNDDSIKIGAPLSTAYLYGWGAERGIRLAAEEINAAGGIEVGGEKRKLSVEVLDTRDLEPGVPVDDASSRGSLLQQWEVLLEIS